MDVVVTQQDIDRGVEFYCMCHGWRKLASRGDLCPNTYASAAAPLETSADWAGPIHWQDNP